MVNFANVLDVIEKEKRLSCSDGAVFGGFAQWLFRLAEDVEDSALKQLAVSYLQTAPAKRPELLLQIESLILRRQQGAQAEARPVPAVKSDGVTHLLDKETLDSEDSTEGLSTPVAYIKGIGDKRAALFQKLGVYTAGDMVFFYPRNYEDRRKVTAIAEVAINEVATVRGKIIEIEEYQPNHRIYILKVWLQDATGMLPVIWFNQKFLKKSFSRGMELLVRGKLEKKYSKQELTVQDYEILGKEENLGSVIVPIYPATEKLSQKIIRKTVLDTVDKYEKYIGEVLPQSVLEKENLFARRIAVREMHLPTDFETLKACRNRLAYEELFLLQMALLRQQSGETQPGIAHSSDKGILGELKAVLPFQFTQAQERVIGEIYQDMEKREPMARLVQGDVGCGKTAVAMAALLKAVRSGHQCAMMAPTEILAQQHYGDLSQVFEQLHIRVACLTGRVTGKARKTLLEEVANGKIQILVGTHAIIQEHVEFHDLSLAITDEQHRFGVLQRSVLQEKGAQPDVLIMTATPIPRTLSMSLYGDLHLSVIDQLPPGRQKIDTFAVDHSYEERIWRFIKKEVDKGGQAYVVCPLVEESEKMDMQSAVDLVEKISKKDLKGYRVGLLHGKMKGKEKEEITSAFVRGEIQVLVSTTVIEVGVNVPNATVMLVWDAHRFGLAQLHQLRGRVGRGTAKSYCILMHNAKSEVSQKRMETMVSTQNGFEIAEADLSLRGPGEFFGVRQHGLPQLKVADIFSDGRMMEQARKDAKAVLDGKFTVTEEEMAVLDHCIAEKFLFTP
ncbi:MAG: ATP-dependent DNA helicase RecG [Peptococcaceae bacterium]|nr:ATP-dependent DNA helicase RecG [Peptococcaceae bacterium]